MQYRVGGRSGDWGEHNDWGEYHGEGVGQAISEHVSGRDIAHGDNTIIHDIENETMANVDVFGTLMVKRINQ